MAEKCVMIMPKLGGDREESQQEQEETVARALLFLKEGQSEGQLSGVRGLRNLAMALSLLLAGAALGHSLEGAVAGSACVVAFEIGPNLNGIVKGERVVVRQVWENVQDFFLGFVLRANGVSQGYY